MPTTLETINRPFQREINTFSWQDNVSVQRLLDTIASIIAEGYIQVAKSNPKVFKERESV